MIHYTSVTPTKIRLMTEFNQLSGEGIPVFNRVFDELAKNGYTHLSGTPAITKPLLMDLVTHQFITQSEYTAIEKLINEIEAIETHFSNRREAFIAKEIDQSDRLIPTIGFSSVNLSLTDVADYLDAGFIEDDEAHLIIKVLNRKKIAETPSFSITDLELLSDHNVVSDDEFTEIKEVFESIASHEYTHNNKRLTKDEIVLTKDNLKVLMDTARINESQLTRYLGHIATMPKFYQLLQYKDSHALLKIIK